MLTEKIVFFSEMANKITKEQMLSVTFYQIVNILDLTTERDFYQLGLLYNRKWFHTKNFYIKFIFFQAYPAIAEKEKNTYEWVQIDDDVMQTALRDIIKHNILTPLQSPKLIKMKKGLRQPTKNQVRKKS